MTNALVEQQDKLSLKERMLLSDLALGVSWAQACRNLGIDPKSARQFRKKPAFQAEFIRLTRDVVSQVETEIKSMAGDAAEIIDAAKDAEMERKVAVVCPKCSHSFNVMVKVMDWATKLGVADRLLKVANILKDQKSLKIDGEVRRIDVKLTAGQFMALERLRMGFSIPEYVY